MPAYHVFVDGAADRSPAGLERLATAIAEHYGLPVSDLRTRIASGRFRVKGNCDGATADMYVRDLTRLGARCSIEEATAHNKALTPLPFPAVKPAAAPAKTSLPPPIGNKQMQSGLAAAYSGDTPVASLGALDDGAMMKLGAVDGSDDAAPANDAAFAPPGGFASASIGPAPEKPKAKPNAKPAAAKPKDEPLDMFVPPDAGSDELKFDLEPEAIERSARKRVNTPPPSEPVAAEPPAAASTPGRYSRPSLPAQDVAASAREPRGLANPKLRLVVGVVLAIAIGFIPAHLVAAAREKSAFAAIDQKIIATQNEADTPDAYALLDTFRADQLARKHSDRRTIAIMAVLIWGAVGGAVAYGWFKRVPWDRVQ